MSNQISIYKSFLLKRQIQTATSNSPFIELARRIKSYFESPNAIFLKDDKASSIIIVEFNGERVVARRDNHVNVFTFFRRMFKKSRALKIWEKSYYLQKNGIETLKPLVLIQDFFLFFRIRSFVVVSLVKGITFKSYLSNEAISLDNKARIISRIISMLKKWHDMGFAHRDPKSSNIMIDNNDVYFIDIEDVVVHQIGFIRKRVFSRDWAIILNNLIDHPELWKSAHEEIIKCFDGDWNYFKKRCGDLPQRLIISSH